MQYRFIFPGLSRVSLPTLLFRFIDQEGPALARALLFPSVDCSQFFWHWVDLFDGMEMAHETHLLVCEARARLPEVRASGAPVTSPTGANAQGAQARGLKWGAGLARHTNGTGVGVVGMGHASAFKAILRWPRLFAPPDGIQT